MTYEIIQSPLTPELKAAIYKEFARHSISTIGFDELANDPIAFEIDDNGFIVGVCVVQLFFGGLHIKYLLVHEEYRMKGIARRLMEHVFQFGKEQGCKFVFVETMSFQAPAFYQKLGFKVELRRDGYAADTSYYYLRMDL